MEICGGCHRNMCHMSGKLRLLVKLKTKVFHVTYLNVSLTQREFMVLSNNVSL